MDGERPSPQEEDKAKMLFGNRHAVSIYFLHLKLFNNKRQLEFLFSVNFSLKIRAQGKECSSFQLNSEATDEM